MKKMLIVILTLLTALVLLVSSTAIAETVNTKTDYVLHALESSGTEEHVIWELQTSHSDDPIAEFSTPGEGDIEQKEALRIALDALFSLTDKSAEDIFNGYQIRFSFCETPGTRYWTVFFGVGIGKMGGASYVVDVFSNGNVKRFEDIGDRGYF